MRLAGVIPLENGQNQGFSLIVETPFKAFSGTHHVLHTLQPHLSGDMLSLIPIEKLGRIFPLQIIEFRFGIERFRSRRAFSMLGFVPTVCDGFNLEVREERLRLSLFCDYQKTSSQELFEGGWLDEALLELSSSILGTSWKELLKNKDNKIN